MQTDSSAVLSHTHIYPIHREEFIQYTHKEFLSFILNKKNKTILTIKRASNVVLACLSARKYPSAEPEKLSTINIMYNFPPADFTHDGPHKSVIFYTFIKVLTYHYRTGTRYILYQWGVLNDSCDGL